MSTLTEDIINDLSFGDPDGQALQVSLLAMIPGSVLDRQDPKGLGRVRAKVQGLFEQGTEWLTPLTQSGGSPGKGAFDPPLKNAAIYVFFPLGSVEEGVGFYISGGWGKKADIPEGAVVEGDRQRAVTEDKEWIIARDDRTNSKEYNIKSKAHGTEFQMTENLILEPSSIGGGYLSRGATQRVVKGDDLSDYFGTVINPLSLLGYLELMRLQIVALGGVLPTPPPSFPSSMLSDKWRVK